MLYINLPRLLLLNNWKKKQENGLQFEINSSDGEQTCVHNVIGDNPKIISIHPKGFIFHKLKINWNEDRIEERL